MTKKKVKKVTKPKAGEHRCTQTQCSYYLEGGCKKCSKCNAVPFVINDSCTICFDCENKSSTKIIRLRRLIEASYVVFIVFS